MSRERLALGAAPSGAQVLAHGAEAVGAFVEQRARAAAEERGRLAAAEVLDQVVVELAARAEESRAALARTAAELAIEIARTLVRSELARGAHDVERIVRGTLEEAAVGRSPCVVHLNPADHARLSVARFRSGTRLEPDEGVARGDVHVETSLGLFVRDLDAALDAIARRLQEELA